MSQQNEITENTTVGEVMARPGAIEVLGKYRLPCLHCPMAAMEVEHLKIGEVAKAYGINAKELIKELNLKTKGG